MVVGTGDDFTVKEDSPLESADNVETRDVRGVDFEVLGRKVVGGCIEDGSRGDSELNLVAVDGDVAVDGYAFAGHFFSSCEYRIERERKVDGEQGIRRGVGCRVKKVKKMGRKASCGYLCTEEGRD
jgi:hypothetical protein